MDVLLPFLVSYLVVAFLVGFAGIVAWAMVRDASDELAGKCARTSINALWWPVMLVQVVLRVVEDARSK